MSQNLTAGLMSLSDAILCSLAYGDVFDYPMTAAEIHRYLPGLPAGQGAVYQELARLVQRDSLLQVDSFFTLPGRTALAKVRRQRLQTSARLWPLAHRFGRIMASLPFVRMLAVTGSLAMNNVANEADIDYLVVTAPGRLWLCRALLLGVVRFAALRGMRLCPNYLISERVLVFTDQSLYTAHELAQMVPLYGLAVYQHLYQLNAWRARYLPNAGSQPAFQPGQSNLDRRAMLQPALEAALRTPPGAWIEAWEMARKVKRLSRQQMISPESQFTADVCKGHLNRHGLVSAAGLRQRLESLSLEIIS